MKIEEKIERFFWDLEKLMKSSGFQYISDDETKYCNDKIGWLEESFEKNDKYVDVDLKVLLDEDCNLKEVKDIVIYYDEDILSDELYQRIIELYKKFLGEKP